MSITKNVRTTVTLDQDTLEGAKAYAKRRQIPFREALNELVRSGLLAEPVDAPVTMPLPQPRHMGLHPGLNYDNTEGLISLSEGDQHG